MTNGEGAGGSGSPPLVALEGITKRFPGVLANDEVDLELRAGEVHALIGENGAGKSTLMRVLYGMYPSDGGRILVRGNEVKIASPRDAIANGIGMVHQHFVLVDPFTVTENIILGEEGGERLDMDAARQRVADLADSYAFRVDPGAVVENLSVGEEQRVEILKALYRGVEILILDEPTAVLTPSETKDLFGNLRKLREAGRTIVFISHKLDEVMEIADRITVLRRGRVVGQTTPAETSKAKLAEMMVGRPVLFRLEKPTVEIGEPVLRVEGLTGEGKLNGISLEVRAGEILGVAGVEGNGQRELAESLIGLRTPESGTIDLEGAPIGGRGVFVIRNAGVAYIPEDRHEQGLVLNMSLWENAVLGRQDDTDFSGKLGVLFIKKIKDLAARLVELFDIRTRSVDVEASTLSGGNQQKLILARELETDPKLLIAAQPTRGLDVGAIEFVWKQIL
ncbi:MAG TPA: ABC transporter ATP-binding protein, partial [Actinomycetota bacterium]|nr:ABC transporter ATP-binding protein [Actinomycetota bacterium]